MNKISQQSIDYDVTIVGGGPGGSTAGYLLKKLGLNVQIIDKDVFPRQKLCGGILTFKTFKLLKRVFGETVESLLDKHIINYSTNRFEINYKVKRIMSSNISHFPFYLVDRVVYDNFLLDKAKEAGVDVIEGDRVEKVNLDTCEISLSKGGNFKSNFIIGADGANSIVKQEFIRNQIIRKEQWNYNLATGLECFIDRKDLDKRLFKFPMISFGFLKYGYNWLFPNKDKVILGVGGLNRKNKGYFKNALRNFISALGINPNIVSEISGHPIPYGNFKITPIYKNKVILIGDAAGIADPFWGEGIFYSQKTAEFASYAILKNLQNIKKSTTLYLHLLTKYLYSEFQYVMKLRWVIFNQVNALLKYYPTHLLLKMMRGKLIELTQGIRSYRWLRLKDYF